MALSEYAKRKQIEKSNLAWASRTPIKRDVRVLRANIRDRVFGYEKASLSDLGRILNDVD